MLACAAALDHAFEERALQTQYDRMQGLAYALLAATEPTADGTLSLSMFRLPDSRLNNPGAGLASALIDERGGLTWGSISLTDDVPLPPMVAPGEWSFESTDTSFILAFGLRWANPVEGDQTYTLLIIEDRATFRRQVAGFRRTLWSWLAVAAIGLLSVQGAILAWGLGPLRRLRRDLRLVEKGKQTALGGRYPQELVPLSEAINGMISTGQAQLERHRHALGDLAHSLKTPLAVLRGMSEDERLNAELRQQIAEPVARMHTIVDHQLRRAVMAGRRTLTEPVALREVIEKLSRTIEKVYRSKVPRFELDIPPTLKVRIDGGDLFEMMGNLLENAVKYGKGRVRVHASRSRQGLCTIRVEDDGDGFPESPERLLSRGVRADTLTPGQGIGLGASAELVAAYRGQVQLTRSESLGGGAVIITLVA
ncbi:MAG: ATP-binding protein [Gammaproteobacteria bacterium]|nr:ATP-binding protein [Gammaproteobacteria bacterium]